MLVIFRIIDGVSVGKILDNLGYLKHFLGDFLFLLYTEHHSGNPIIRPKKHYEKNTEDSHHDQKFQECESFFRLHALIISNKTFQDHFSCFRSLIVEHMRFHFQYTITWQYIISFTDTGKQNISRKNCRIYSFNRM